MCFYLNPWHTVLSRNRKVSIEYYLVDKSALSRAAFTVEPVQAGHYLGGAKQKGVFGHIRTVKALISLRMRAD